MNNETETKKETFENKSKSFCVAQNAITHSENTANLSLSSQESRCWTDQAFFQEYFYLINIILNVEIFITSLCSIRREEKECLSSKYLTLNS